MPGRRAAGWRAACARNRPRGKGCPVRARVGAGISCQMPGDRRAASTAAPLAAPLDLLYCITGPQSTPRCGAGRRARRGRGSGRIRPAAPIAAAGRLRRSGPPPPAWPASGISSAGRRMIVARSGCAAGAGSAWRASACVYALMIDRRLHRRAGRRRALGPHMIESGGDHGDLHLACERRDRRPRRR